MNVSKKATIFDDVFFFVYGLLSLESNSFSFFCLVAHLQIKYNEKKTNDRKYHCGARFSLNEDISVKRKISHHKKK